MIDHAEWNRKVASRILLAIRNHPDVEVRGWGARALTRAVAAQAGIELREDSGAAWLRTGAHPRDPNVAIALAEVLQVDPGWLYFGDRSKAPRPDWADTQSP